MFKVFVICLVSLTASVQANAQDGKWNEGPYEPQPSMSNIPYVTRDWLNVPVIDEAFQEKSIIEFGMQDGELALTIDDGPSENSLRVLELLEKYNIKVTFFLIGSNAQKHLDIVEKEAQAGHAIGNHTLNHLMNYTTPEQLILEAMETHKIIQPFVEKYGTRRLYYRSPGGNWNAWRFNLLSGNSILNQYVGPIYWNVGGELVKGSNGQIIASADWACWRDHISPEACAQGYYNEILTRKKGVILMHDITPNSAEMLGFLLQKLTEGGRDGKGNGEWKFRYFDEMEYMKKYE